MPASHVLISAHAVDVLTFNMVRVYVVNSLQQLKHYFITEKINVIGEAKVNKVRQTKLHATGRISVLTGETMDKSVCR
jgi:hypothetical protein